MRILITGGTGFVGLNLAEALLHAGHHVVFFDLREPPAAFVAAVASMQDRLHVLHGDVNQWEDLEGAFAGGDITHVFHGAAITPDAARESAAAQQIIDVNLSGTVAIVRAAAQAGVTRLVFPSSLSVYGPHLYGDRPVDEAATPPAPETLYGITKFAAERTALRLGELWNLGVVAGRIGSAFGPWEGETQVRDQLSPYAQLAAMAATGKPAILPEIYARREMIYSRDLAQALMLLLFAPRPAHAVYNLSVNGDWVQLLPRWCAHLTERMDGFGWRYAAPDEAASIVYPDNRPRVGMHTARLRKDLGFAPAFTGDAALRDYAQWLTAHHAYFQ